MILIIAYGNTLRQDDGAGLALGQILEKELRARRVDVERITVHQLMPELALELARERVKAVIFVDTRVATDDDTLKVQILPLFADTPSPSIGHHLNPVTVLVYARLLYNKQLPAWQLTVPGVNFEHGEEFSTIAQVALATAPELLTDWLAEFIHCPA